MNDHLKTVASSYDRTIDLGKKGIDLYQNLPNYITSDPDYPAWKTEMEEGNEGSVNKDILNYLQPQQGMNFIDLGCSLNLMFHGYDEWPSTYHGVDISEKTILLLNEVVEARKLSIGSLVCGSIHDTPFADDFFDIGACIGVLEYFKKDYVEKAILEAHRILKPRGRLVLDIPNISSPSGRMMMKIEESMGRASHFELRAKEFEELIQNYFEIVESNRVAAGIEAMGITYYLKCKK